MNENFLNNLGNMNSFITGIDNSNTFSNDLKTDIERQKMAMLDKQIKESYNVILKQSYNISKSIMREVYGIYTTIVRKTFEDVFTEFYGSGYDIVSLHDALGFMMGGNLVPEFFFDKTKFHFNSDLEKNMRKFNENSREYASFGRFENPDFYLGDIESLIEEELEDYGEDSEYDEEDIMDDIQYEYLSMQPTNKTLIEGAMATIDNVVKIATNKSLIAFNVEYVSRIKPRLIKKYKINL